MPLLLLLLSDQDMTRTGTYHAVMMENKLDFHGKAVMDVGAGSGVLSMFAAQVRAPLMAAERTSVSQDGSIPGMMY
jgi:histone-arginine methyltransferase CARM1